MNATSHFLYIPGPLLRDIHVLFLEVTGSGLGISPLSLRRKNGAYLFCNLIPLIFGEQTWVSKFAVNYFERMDIIDVFARIPFFLYSSTPLSCDLWSLFLIFLRRHVLVWCHEFELLLREVCIAILAACIESKLHSQRFSLPSPGAHSQCSTSEQIVQFVVYWACRGVNKRPAISA